MLPQSINITSFVFLLDYRFTMLSLYYFVATFACFISSITAANNAAATVTVTNLQTSTVFVTTSYATNVPLYLRYSLLTVGRAFAYSVSTATVMATSTKTTYVSETSPAARRVKGRGIKRADEIITTTINAGLTITSYINIGATQFAQTVTSTSTTILSLAAPTYSHVYSATAGCQDTPTVDTLQLDSSITDKDTAIAACQNSCSQNGKCASLFVQYLFPNYGSTAPVYKCFMNGQNFVEDSSLTCGLAENVWGVADAFDAVGRGVPY